MCKQVAHFLSLVGISSDVVIREGFEPPTPALGRRRSNPLSYRTKVTTTAVIITD